MRLNSYEVVPALKKHSSNILALLVAGDEPYLSLSLADQARAFYRENGFQERELFEVDGKFDWGNFTNATQSLSLFSEKGLLRQSCRRYFLTDFSAATKSSAAKDKMGHGN